MKIACPKKIVSNIPVLASVCFMRSVCLTQYSASQELFIKFMTRSCRKCYTSGSFPKTLRQLNVNEGNFILTWNSGIELDRLKNSTLENELLNVAERLSKLGERIDQSSYEEKRRAVVELVKDIQAVPEIINGNQIPIVTITYRFNEPCPQELISLPAVLQDCTPGRAVQYNGELEIARKWQQS